MDTSSGSLTRLITDKHDRMTDQMIRRLENLDESTGRGLEDLKGEMKGIKRSISVMKGEIKDLIKSNNDTKELFKELEEKLGTLQINIENSGCQCQHVIAEQSANDLESDRYQRATWHRRTESAHGALGQGGSRQQHMSEATHSSKSARQSGKGSKSQRSITLNNRQGSKAGDERKKHFAELGTTRGAVPNIQDHPAYAGVRQGLGQVYGPDHDGMPTVFNSGQYANSSFSDGHWYQQAYGQNQ